MQLDDFVAETIRQIAAGVQRGQIEARKLGTIVNPAMLDRRPSAHGFLHPEMIKNVEFDVAVTTSEGTETKGGIGVSVLAVKLGSQGKSDATSTTANRIKFNVPITYPAAPVN